MRVPREPGSDHVSARSPLAKSFSKPACCAALAVERHDCPNCEAPAGSACRTRGGKTAAKYHTLRFVLVPALRAPRGTGDPRTRRPAPRPGVEAGPGARCRARAPHRAAAPDRVRPRLGSARQEPAEAGSSAATVRNATRSSRRRSAPASSCGPNWRRRSRQPTSSRKPPRRHPSSSQCRSSSVWPGTRPS
ncbi:zinc finger domain-containing protein [Streptomyces sp. NBC_01294]|uniref:zinc finger domain-containing protein n=1 Tax=Streptomyces sp. NBC_01294 TaxID=2903815 RepID=UPI003FA366D8